MTCTETIAEKAVAEMYRGTGRSRKHKLYLNRDRVFAAEVFEDGSAMLTRSGTQVNDPERYTARPGLPPPVRDWIEKPTILSWLQL